MHKHRLQWVFSVAVFWPIFQAGLCLANEAEIQNKSKALAHYMMGVMADLNGDNQQAAFEYQKSTKFDSQQALPHLRLGAYYVRLGQPEEAIRHVKVVLKFQPDSYQGHYLLALIYSSQKKYTLAAAEYEKVLKSASQTNPENFEIHAYLAQLYYAQHQYAKALEQLDQILQFQPKNVSALFLLGSVYLDTDSKDKAKEYFRKVLALEPEHDGALNSLSYMYAEAGVNLDEALKMVNKAVEIDPTNGAYYDTLGWVLFKQRLNAEALMALEKAENYITDPIIYEHMGDIYKETNQPAMARKYWLKSLALDQNQPKLVLKIEQLNKTTAQAHNIDHFPAK